MPAVKGRASSSVDPLAARRWGWACGRGGRVAVDPPTQPNGPCEVLRGLCSAP